MKVIKYLENIPSHTYYDDVFTSTIMNNTIKLLMSIDITSDVVVISMKNLSKQLISTSLNIINSASSRTYRSIHLLLVYSILKIMDLFYFPQYNGFKISDNLTMNSKNINFVRNQYLTGYMEDSVLNEMINIFQKYQLFYPIHRYYYVDMIESLLESGISNAYDLDKNKYEINLKYQTTILKLNSGLELLGVFNNLILRCFTPKPSDYYDKNVPLTKKIKVIDYKKSTDTKI